ncbi:DCC1-like thiol-disulfide oxidoreductase family protein [Dermatophilaceae bacterium Soc4.6]
MTSRPPVLVFDGDCGFCTTSAGLVPRLVDRRRRFVVRPWQQLDLPSLGLTPEMCSAAVQFVDADRRVSSGAPAIAAALRAGAPGWHPAGVVLDLPGVRSVAARVYTWVAAHRYALPGGTPACAMPPPAPSSPSTPG